MKVRTLGALCVAIAMAQPGPALSQGQANSVLTLPKALQAAVNANPRIAVADRNIGMADGRRQQA